jgi:hypothetical protein
MKNTLKIFFAFGFTAVFFTACKKDFDSPPKKEIPVGNVLTISALKALHTGTSIKFTEDYSVYGVVTADETSGNLYKNIFMQDATGAINVRLLTSGGVYQGDSIRLYLKGCVLSKYNGMMQVDSVNADNNIIKQATGKSVVAQSVSISQINTSLQSRLIRLDSVEFIPNDAAKTFADAINQQSKNLTLEDCSGATVIMRNSGYANFAGSLTPIGKGTVYAIVGEFNGTMQLYIRSLNDVNLSGPRCPGSVIPYISKDFEDNSITSAGWHVEQVSGTNINWTTATFGGSTFAKISNYIPTVNYACENWLISPSINLSSSSVPNLYFDNAYKYTGTPLQLMISTNYSGSGNPNLATWTNLTSSALWSSGNYVFVNSGAVSLGAFKTNGVYIAFKYTGTNVDGSTWEVDNIKVQEN